MGIDYGYNLYLPERSVGRALRAFATIARDGDDRVEVPVPGGERITLPFRLPYLSGPADDVNHWCLDTCLCFPVADEVIRAWSETERRAGRQTRQDARGRLWIGSIYLSYYRECGLRPGYSSLDFTAATTGMSRLFEQSSAIRDTFVDLGASAGAVAVVLDREDDGTEVCWPPGGGDLATLAAGWPEIR